jgi:carbonic anhydrase/acetyltransferase-like protein (isoleucine patch superfamily)
MPIYELEGVAPRIDPTAFIHPEAVVIGDVTIGAHSSIWPCAVLRGEPGKIVIGSETSVQDGTVVHCGVPPGCDTVIGDRCVIGHLAHLEGCTLEDESLAGSGSVILHHAVIGTRALVAANAVITDKMLVPPDALAVGIPARILEGRSDVDLIRETVVGYAEKARRYRATMRRIG